MAGGFLNRWSRLKSGEQSEPEKKSVDQIKQELASKPEVQHSTPDTLEAPSLQCDGWPGYLY